MFDSNCDQWSHSWVGFGQVILALSIAIVTIFWLQRVILRKLKNGTVPLPPGPYGLPLLGYLPFLGTDLHLQFTELGKIYGSIYKLQLGNKLCVVLSSPALIQEVVRDHDITFANRDPTVATSIFSHGGADIAFAPYSPDWRMLRKIFAQLLSNGNLDACYDLRRREVRRSIRDVYSKIGEAVDIGGLADLTVTSVMTSMLWGGNGNDAADVAVRAEFGALASKIMVLVGKPNISDFFPLLSRFDLQGVEREMKKISLWMDRIFNLVIDKRMKMGMEKEDQGTVKDFLQFLLEVKEQQDSGTSISLKQIKTLLADFMIGGTQTVSNSVEWAMVKLIQNPKVMEKAHEELTYVVGLNNIVEEFHLSRLVYLNAIVKETLRLHPTAPLLIPHCPTQSCIVGGYTIPKGTRIFLNIWALHRDPQVWDSPLEFRPERFLNLTSPLDYSGRNYEYLPFGSGRRLCPGISLAERMLMYMLASLLHLFHWKLPNGTKLDFSATFGNVLKKSKPLVAIPTPRLSNFSTDRLLI